MASPDHDRCIGIEYLRLEYFLSCHTAPAGLPREDDCFSGSQPSSALPSYHAATGSSSTMPSTSCSFC